MAQRLTLTRQSYTGGVPFILDYPRGQQQQQLNYNGFPLDFLFIIRGHPHFTGVLGLTTESPRYHLGYIVIRLWLFC